MRKNERPGDTAGKIASKALKDPSAVTEAEIKTLAASVLTQRPDKPKAKAKAASKAKPKAR
jgi:carnitine O-acetyltransferase